MTSPATTNHDDDDDVVYGFSGKQKRAYMRSDGKVNIWDGAVRSGKTYAWTHLILREVKNYGGGAAILISGKNRDSIYRNVFEPIENDPTLALVRPFVHYRQGAAHALIWGKKVHVVGANDDGSENKIRGMTIGRAFSDEITITNKSFFKQLMARLSKRGAKLWATTNPDTPGHWLMTDYLSKIPGCRHFKTTTPEGDQLPHWTYWHFTMEDNPSLDDEYKDNLRREYTGVWFRRFILGEWVAADGAIYDFFDTNTHVIDHDQLPQMERVLALGIDYGTTHPTAGMLLGLASVDGKYRLYVMDEWSPNYPPGSDKPVKLTDKALSDDLKRWRQARHEPEWTFVDPAAGSFKLQLYDDGHPRLANARNDVLDGIRTVASLLASGDMLISSACEHLIQELPGYRWDDKATERGEEAPIKDQDDFCLVGNTQVQTLCGMRDIGVVCEGDYVLTRDGYRKVLASAKTQDNAQVKTITTADGGTITGTDNHPMWVDGKGWTPLGDLKPGDVLLRWNAKSSHSTESSSTATPTQSNKPTGATTSPESRTLSVVWKRFTGKFGNTTTEPPKSPKDSTSITSTTTTTTIIPTTSPSLKGGATSATTCESDSSARNIGRNTLNALPLFATSPPHGTARMRGSNGTARTESKSGQRGNRIASHANNVVRNMKLNPGMARNAFVRTLANLRGDAQRAWTMFSGRVSGAATSGLSISTARPELVAVPVVELSDAGSAPVFNLTVEGNHEYLANGYVTHNCDSLRYAVFSSRNLWRPYIRENN